MILSKEDYYEFIQADSLFLANFLIPSFWDRIVNHALRTPLGDKKYIWRYIRSLRKVEFYQNTRKTSVGGAKILKYIAWVFYMHKLRCYSRKTGFQIDPNTVDKGIIIWHFGAIIVNAKSRIGRNCTLNPGVVIGHKDSLHGAPIIGNDCYIGAGAKVIGEIKVGDDVFIAPNSIVVKNIPSHSMVAGIPAKIIKKRNTIDDKWTRV